MPKINIQHFVQQVLNENDERLKSLKKDYEEDVHRAHRKGVFGRSFLHVRRDDGNLKNEVGRTALHYTASKGWVKVVEILLSNGAKVGCTPLNCAASIGKSELCELLIEEGADIDDVDRAGQTPLMNAVICYNKERQFEAVNRVCEIVKTQLAFLDGSVVAPESTFSPMAPIPLTKEIVDIVKSRVGYSGSEVGRRAKLRTSFRVPANLNDGNVTPLQLLDFTIYDLHWFFNKVELIINTELIQRNHE
nr:26S proteasome non-ATPase regulatory subunit 10 [Tanacetum cinerariifolium]